MLAKNPMAEAWGILDAITDAEAKMADLVSRAGPIICELSDKRRIQWYLVRVKPGDDIKAMHKLADRRFGVFRPMRQREDARNGTALQGRVPVLPGWLFVMPWDMEQNRKRIINCPGVAEIFCFPNTDKPVPIADGFIDELRALADDYAVSAPEICGAQRRGTRVEVKVLRQENRVRRLKKGQRKELANLKARARQLGVFDQSTWETMNTLDPGKRIALLKRALLSTALAGCPT